MTTMRIMDSTSEVELMPTHGFCMEHNEYFEVGPGEDGTVCPYDEACLAEPVHMSDVPASGDPQTDRENYHHGFKRYVYTLLDHTDVTCLGGAPTPEPVDAWLDAVAEQVTAQDCHEAAQAGAYAVAELVERAARIALVTELRRIAAAFDEWHVEGAEKLLRGEPTHKALVRSYAVRDGLLSRAMEIEA